SHIYQAQGNYHVTVYVTGPDGQTASATTTLVSVSPLPEAASRTPSVMVPIAYPGSEPLAAESLVLGTEPEINAFAGVGFALNPVTEITGEYNSSQDNTTSDYHAQINWGDSPQWDANVGLTALGTSGVLVKGSHIYQAQGNYSVTVYVTGPDGQTVSATTTLVSVAPLPDAASRPPHVPTTYTGAQALAAEELDLGTEPEINAFAGVGFALNPVTDITGQYNDSQDNTTSDYRAQINWGDGPNWDANVGLTALGTSGLLVKGSHIYQSQGNYHVTVYVTGPDGQTINATTTLVSVALLPDAASRPPDVPTPYSGAQPLATVGLDLSTEPEINATAGVAFAPSPVTEIDGTYNNSPDTTAGDYHAQINWGDGPQWDTNTTLTSTSSGVLVKGEHTYQDQGSYAVTLYVTGPDGQTESDTTTEVEVSPNPNAISLGILTPAQWTVNQPGYDGTIPVTGGTGGYQNLQVSGLPSGLKAAVSSSTVDGQLSGTITITGTPTQSGTFPLTTTLDDTEGDTGSGTETLTITPKQTPTIQIAINDTVSTNDNITLYIPPGSAQPYTQTVPARITNLGSDAATFQLMVTQAGSGNVTLSQTSMQLASGASAEITITPTADSSSVNDVHIIATAEDGTQLAEDDMTVVMVTVPNVISNADTPAAMLAAGAYRIPPRVSTPETIQVTPSLSGSGQSVTLIVADQSATNGTVTIGGNASQAVTSSGSIQLSSQSGNTQTAPGNAAQLHLALQVRGQNTIQSSRGFSVAAIPQYVEDVLQASLTGTVRGIQVANVWKSDSGVLGDLNDVTIQEQVRSVSASGIFSGRPFVTSGPLAATLTSPSYPNLGISIDTHSFPISWITNQVYTGTRVAAQTSDFV
ncbi:MAG TPA: hypothetical protein VKA15_22535, partial [Isosphaeraceae bacterium]|nr:hypothetical protein [Isosphaeraceae bacterium]